MDGLYGLHETCILPCENNCLKLTDVKQFSHILPYESLGHAMLYNAFLACGARHLSLVNQTYTEEHALYYYNKALGELREQINSPSRNMELCATTSVVLNVYEVMAVNKVNHMSHLSGARALIQQCGWSARSTGIGAACFWLNIGMELLSCLHLKWTVSWEPDEWGVDMRFPAFRETRRGVEFLWTHRIVYLLAKVANFSTKMPGNLHDTSALLKEWTGIKHLVDEWDRKAPRTMLPMAFVPPQNTLTQSSFPEIWLPERKTVFARLFYHTAQVLLSQSHPFESSVMQQMHDLRLDHARQICGICRHVKDR